jgi:hypothetical protein
MFASDREAFERAVRTARETMGDDEFEQCRQVGLEMNIAEALDYASSLL